MKEYRLINNLSGWFVFLLASIVYLLTVEPTASFWDCGEYITVSYKLQVGHPPGAPTFQLIGRFFTMFAFGNVENVALMINILSAFCSSFSILFLFWSITLIAKKFVIKSFDNVTLYQKICVFSAGFVGAMAYTFTDSFWFSAVEGEVYAMSSLATAITFWAALKWDENAHNPESNKWLLFIAYLVGLSIGIHLLNLLVLPAIAYIVYFKKYKFSPKGFLATTFIGIGLLWLILYIIIPGIVILAGKFEIFFINNIGLPFNSGTVIYLLTLISLIIYGLYYTVKHNKVIANLVFKSFVFILIGYSTYFTLVIRSNADTPINENAPTDAVSLLSFLLREQYGDTPLFYGPYYGAPYARNEKWGDRSPVYKKDTIQKKYVIIDKREGTIPVYDSEFCTFFPRMWSNEPHHVRAYESWGKIKGVMIPYHTGHRTEMIKKPTFGENLRFFFTYQIGHMYLRYFMWNFAGRQNDSQGHGDLMNGNWISGFNIIDNRLGPQEFYPENMKQNKGRNRYYLLPLILGLGGLYFLMLKNPKDAFIVGVLFFMTGIAIILYTNQTPYQPRERDYAFAASFYAFAIWIGIGVLWINHLIRKWLIKGTASIIIAAILSTIAVPYVLAKENWDDHDRSNRYTGRDIAKNYLDSCEPNAILFTNGDNDTFPLWYVQEVEGYRTDVRVVNLSLLNTDWYINSMRKKAYDGEPVPFSLKEHQYQTGSLDVVYLMEHQENTSEFVNIKDIFNVIHNQPNRLKTMNQGREFNFFPTKNFRLPVDSATVVDNGTVSPKNAHLIVDNVDWRIDRNMIFKNAVMLIDLLANNNWERPIYFAITIGEDAYFGLQDYFQLEGLAYRLVPIKTPKDQNQTGIIHTEKLYKKLVHDFKWGNLQDENIYLDETNRRMTMNFRSNFARLANQLLIEGDSAKALESLDKAVDIMPEKNIPYNFFVVPIVEGYYKLSKYEKGDSILTRLIDITDENLNFYFSFKGDKATQVRDEKEQELAILNRIVQTTQKYNRKELFALTSQIFQNYYQIWEKEQNFQHY